MKIFNTKEEAINYAVETYGQVQVETEVVNIIKVSPMIAKHLKCSTGFAIDKEMN